MNERKQIRQGDVLLVPVPSVPANMVETPRDQYGRVVLAEGEQHGHAHALHDKHVTGFRAETAEQAAILGIKPELRAMTDFILVGGSSPATLKHELFDGQKADHDADTIAPGAYRVVQQREDIGDEAAVQSFD